jgi:high-affinity iron transporter
VIFLQNLRELYGSSAVLEGVVLGAMFTVAVGVLTFTLHQKLPYKRLLIITGVMLLLVLLVSVGEEVQEMQLAGWIGTTGIPGLRFPGWMGTWFSLFGNWQTVAAQLVALTLVVGSYLAAEHMRVRRPRRRGQRPAVAAQAPPERPADLGTAARRAAGSGGAAVAARHG